MNRLILLVLLFFSIDSVCQVDQHKLDSLARAIASQQQATRVYQDSFTKVQDSIYHIETGRGAKADTNLQAGLQTGKKETRSRFYVRLAGAVLLFGILIIALFIMQKRKQS